MLHDIVDWCQITYIKIFRIVTKTVVVFKLVLRKLFCTLWSVFMQRTMFVNFIVSAKEMFMISYTSKYVNI